MLDSRDKTLSEEFEESPWCPTLLDENMTMVEDNWGLCEKKKCPIQDVDRIFFNNDFGGINLKRRFDKDSFNPQLTCEDNPCGDPRMSLPHR